MLIVTLAFSVAAVTAKPAIALKSPSDLRWFNSRYARVEARKYDGEAAPGLPATATWGVYDADKGQVIEVRANSGQWVLDHTDALFDKTATVLNTKNKPYSVVDVELIDYDPEHKAAALQVTNRHPKLKARRSFYLHWDLGTGALTWTAPMENDETAALALPMRSDPSGKRFYFARLSFAGANFSGGCDKLTIVGVDRSAQKIELELPVALNVHASVPLCTQTLYPNHDLTRVFYPEYSETSSGKLDPPAHGHVIDLGTKASFAVAVPVSPYGVAWSADSSALYVGSNELGTISRIEVAQKKIAPFAKTHRQLNKLALSPDGKTLFAFSDRKPVTPFSLPHGKSEKAIEVVKMTGWENASFSPDGKHGLLRKPDETGFPDGKEPGVQVIEIGDSL